MSIDASAVARVLGVETVFEDRRGGGILFLPQRIAVFAQGATDATFSLAKFQGTSSKQVGDRVGYGTPMHHIARQLFPSNNDGVGSIPVTFYPLDDASGAAAAAGAITPTGTQTAKAAYRVRVANILSEQFVISASETITNICRLM